MRVAIVTETYPPEINGSAFTVAGLARGLQQAGHEVQLIRPRQPLSMMARRTIADISRHAHPKDPSAFRPARALALLRHCQGKGKTRTPCTWRRKVRSVVPATLPCRRPAWHSMQVSLTSLTNSHAITDCAGSRRSCLPTCAKLQRGARRCSTSQLADFLRDKGFDNVELLRRAVDTRLFSPDYSRQPLRREWDCATISLRCIRRTSRRRENLELAARAFRDSEERPECFIWVGDGPSRALQAGESGLHFCACNE